MSHLKKLSSERPIEAFVHGIVGGGVFATPPVTELRLLDRFLEVLVEL